MSVFEINHVKVNTRQFSLITVNWLSHISDFLMFLTSVSFGCFITFPCLACTLDLPL